MPIAITKRPKFRVFLALWFVFALYIFLSYRAIAGAHEWIVTGHYLKEEFSFPESWFANFEVRRRVENGSLRNAKYLSHILAFATVSGVDREKAYALADKILATGLDIDSRDEFSHTPLHSAISTNNPNAVRYLLQRCADPFALTAVGGTDFAQQLDAFAYLERLQEIDPHLDRSRVAHIMNQWTPLSSCDDR